MKRNEFELLLIDRVHYGVHDKYTTELEKEKTSTLTNRINYLRCLYEIPIISLHKSDKDKPLRINHFTKKD